MTTTVRFDWRGTGIVMVATDGQNEVVVAGVDVDDGRIPTKPLYRLAEIALRLQRENPSITLRNDVPKNVAGWLDRWLNLEMPPSFVKPDKNP